MISTDVAQNAVIADLLRALEDEEMTDIMLIGKDGIEVATNRFILSSRSQVMRRMLYGDFRESKSKDIPLDYDGVILEAIVEFCIRNEIPKFRLRIARNDSSTRRLVQLYKAADYLELQGLAKLVAQMTHNLTSRYPSLACAAYDEADFGTPVSDDALLMIRCRPYVSLPSDEEAAGGIACLSPSKLLSIFGDKEVKASELFLFEMLLEWFESCGNPGRKQMAQKCAACLHLQDIEPHDLLSTVRTSGLCSEKCITEAITTQALRASQNHVWTLSTRGKPDIERVLVEGAGSVNANGIYYHIDGLTNGDLYSKREIACGQQNVYTLSISTTDEGGMECKIFCSQLLTQDAVRTLVSKRYRRMESFQPVLQVIDIATNEVDESVSAEEKGRKFAKLHLSDGDHYTNARIRLSAVQGNKIVENSVIKVLRFDTHSQKGVITIRLKAVSVVSKDSGHIFGSPVYYLDVFDDLSEDDSESEVVVGKHDDFIEIEISQTAVNGKNGLEALVEKNQTLCEMYSCKFDVKDKPIHSKIPARGWVVDSHGCGPVPKVRWIPGPSRKPLSCANGRW